MVSALTDQLFDPDTVQVRKPTPLILLSVRQRRIGKAGVARSRVALDEGKARRNLSYEIAAHRASREIQRRRWAREDLTPSRGEPQ